MAALFRVVEVPSIGATQRELRVSGYGLSVVSLLATTGAVRLWVQDSEGPPHFQWSPSGGLLPSSQPVGMAWDGSTGFHGRVQFGRLWVQGFNVTGPSLLVLRIHQHPDAVPMPGSLVVGTKTS